MISAYNDLHSNSIPTWRKRLLRFLITMVLLTYVQVSLAEAKQLTCEQEISDQNILVSDEGCDSNRTSGCNLAEESKQWAQICKDRGVSWSRRFVIFFDTDSLDSGQGTADIQLMLCWQDGYTVLPELIITTTPNLISFTSVLAAWNVDRKSLRAGWGAKRDFQCVIQNVDMSDNLI